MENMLNFFGYTVYKLEIPHIEKHKYYMSESAMRDVGFEAAVSDWVANFRNDFLRWHAEEDMNNQKIALALHLADLKRRGGSFDRHAEVMHFAKAWREQHPFAPELFPPDDAGNLPENTCDIEYVSRNDFEGCIITKHVKLKNGVHIRPSTHLHALLQASYPFKVLMHTAKLNGKKKTANCINVGGKNFIDAARCCLIEFFEFSTVTHNEEIQFYLDTQDSMDIQRFCADMCFLDKTIFF